MKSVSRLTSTEREDAWIYDLRLLNGRIRGLKGVPSVRTRAVSLADCRGWCYRTPAGERVSLELKTSLREFYKVLDTDPAAPILIKACAKLWLRLMTIRPFMDGNRRTARAFLARCFTQQGLTVKSFQALKKFPTTGRLDEDLTTCQLALGRCLTAAQNNAH
ncbi:MAG: Fic/DOC family [Pseudomonadota bacterium]